jgi:ABC-type transport system substrate-binding protein
MQQATIRIRRRIFQSGKEWSHRNGWQPLFRREQVAELYIRAAQILNEELPWIYLFAPDAVVARNERLNGFELSSLGRNMVWNAHEWSVSD